MAKGIKVCKVCGKEYEACNIPKSLDSVFRWQDVSCSPECGAEYLARVNKARGLEDFDIIEEDEDDFDEIEEDEDDEEDIEFEEESE